MHANEREPQGTDISLQTYMHIEREREREGEREKESKDGDKDRQKKKTEKMQRWKRKGGLNEGYDGERKRQRERDSLEEKTGRKAVWCFNRKIRAEGARQACSHHNGSHLRMLLQAWLWMWLTLLGLQHRH